VLLPVPLGINAVTSIVFQSALRRPEEEKQNFLGLSAFNQYCAFIPAVRL